MEQPEPSELDRLAEAYEAVRTKRTPERATLARALTIELRHSYANKGVAFVRNGILYWIDSLGELMRMPALKRTGKLGKNPGRAGFPTKVMVA